MSAIPLAPRRILSLLLLLSSFPLVGQNLLTDGGFESLASPACLQPDQVFLNSTAWYGLEASPDLFINNCDYDESGLFFWDASLKSYEGNQFAGLWSRWNSNGTYVSEGIATQLDAPLIAGKEYLFEIALRSRGAYQGAVSSSNLCALEPDKHLDIYLSPDSIRLAKDTANGTSTTNAVFMAEITDPSLQNNNEGEWILLSTCFRAQGGERFLALMMPLGTFGPLPACADQASSGVFNSFYFNIDQARLTTLPENLSGEMTVCPDGEFTVNLFEVLDFPLLKQAQIIWEDGFEGTLRTLQERRPYQLVATFDCGEIPISLEVQTTVCEPTVYAANAFTPNQDGLNESFRPFIDPEVQIDLYELSIYNRWGNLVFRTQDPNEGWDGSGRLRPQPEGTYVWQLNCQLSTLGESQRLVKSGALLLYR